MSKTKNDEELIQDLIGLKDGNISAAFLLEKINTLKFKYDCSDGFEDILDAIRPFVKDLSKAQIDESAKMKLETIISFLKMGDSPSQYENLKNII